MSKNAFQIVGQTTCQLFSNLPTNNKADALTCLRCYVVPYEDAYGNAHQRDFKQTARDGHGKTLLMHIVQHAGIEGLEIFFENGGQVSPGPMNSHNGKNEIMYVMEYAWSEGLALAMEKGMRFSAEPSKRLRISGKSELMYYAEYCPELAKWHGPLELNEKADFAPGSIKLLLPEGAGNRRQAPAAAQMKLDFYSLYAPTGLDSRTAFSECASQGSHLWFALARK